VETAIHDNAATRSVKVVAANQLKSGDIQIFTSSAAEAIQLKENKGWIKGLGEQAELVVPTYGVIAHGIPTNSINIKDQKATTQRIVAENYTVIPNAEIPYVGWLTKESSLKQASSIVIEFTDPEKANAAIYAGMVWDGHIHQCQLYDRACRVKQCFRCYHYGHIGTQCNASQTCGYCTEQHESRHCRQKGLENFTPRCAVCKGAHTAWSNACPARKKEMERVEQAKRASNFYWPVTPKESTEKPKSHKTRNNGGTQEVQAPTTTARVRIIAQRPIEILEERGIEDVPRAHITGNTSQSINPPVVEPAAETQIATGAQTASEEMPRGASAAPSAEEEWATPTANAESVQELEPLADSQIQVTEDYLLHPQGLGVEQPQSLGYLLDGENDTGAMLDADAWLENLDININNEWIQNTEEIAPSPPTSMATDPRTVLGTIYKACKCPSHQDIYSNWPQQDAELTIALCMKMCMYCGADFATAAHLRKHLNRLKYSQKRNLVIRQEKGGRSTSSFPAWTPIPHRAGYLPRPDSEPPASRPEARITRSQSLTSSAQVVFRQ